MDQDRSRTLKMFAWITASLLLTAEVAGAGPLGDAAKSGDADLVVELLGQGVNVDEADNFGTALHWAAINGHTEVVTLLASGGADLGAKSEMLGTPLHAAATRKKATAIAVLLEYGAKVDALDKEDRTPLHIAVKNGDVVSVNLLIAAGADVNFSRVGQGDNRYKLGEQTPLHVALQEEHMKVASLLRSAGATSLPIASAADALSDADVERGRELARVYCKTCHAIETTDPLPSATDHGPPLIGIYGQEVTRDASFEYSKALRDFGGEWTDDRLYSFIYRPMLTVPGTLMGHQLVKKPKETADITAYLKSQAQ